jgi:DNA-binding NarL/FixJ family response regulator
VSLTNEANVPPPGSPRPLQPGIGPLTTDLSFDKVAVIQGSQLESTNERRAIVAAGHESPTIRIAIIDDHPVFRLGLKRALEREPDLEIAWELSSASNLDTLMRRTPVDLILMDFYMGSGKDGISATRDVMERWPGVKVVVISASVDAGSSLASTKAGADGFLNKATPIAEMIKFIRRVVGGDARKREAAKGPIERRGRSTAKSAPGTLKVERRIGGLSPRQREVLDELRLGRTNRDIAEQLGISIATVNKHVHEVLKVLKVRNRTQAAAAGRRPET